MCTILVYQYCDRQVQEIRKIHPLAKTNTVNQKDINKIPTRLKLATGNYMLQTMRAAYNQNPIDPTCKLCNQAEETVSHFLICCKTLEYLRAPTVNNIIEESSKLFASHCTNPQLDIIQLIINPFHYAVNNSLEANICTSKHFCVVDNSCVYADRLDIYCFKIHKFYLLKRIPNMNYVNNM